MQSNYNKKRKYNNNKSYQKKNYTPKKKVYTKYGRNKLFAKYTLVPSPGAFKRTFDTFFNVFGGNNYVPDTITLMPISNDVANNIQAINLPQQGAALSQRVGNKIALSSLDIKLYVDGKFIA